MIKITADACRCPEYTTTCTRAGHSMTRQEWEVCSGNCPLLLAKNPKASEQVRYEWDRRTSEIAAGREPFPNRSLSLLQKAATLEQELQAWKAAGKPLCTQEEAAARLETCTPCDSNKSGRCVACGGCGIEKAPILAQIYSVATGRGPIPGKAEMRTADCPKQKWPKLDVITS